jgi:penicillin-binding protein 1A
MTDNRCQNPTVKLTSQAIDRPAYTCSQVRFVASCIWRDSIIRYTHCRCRAPEILHKDKSGQDHSSKRPRHPMLRLVIWIGGVIAASAFCVLLLVLIALASAYPNLPEVSDLQNYQPKLPLKVLSAEGDVLGEFGEERRTLTPIDQIPKVMLDAVLAIEDSRFFDHGGVDYVGVVRAGLANVRSLKSQGASTITMQVARNVYLTNERTFTRKIYEILLTFKLENSLTKNQILEIYMNQIFLGHKAYGFAAASEAYFGKPLKDITIAEAAMLAGLPKAPSAYNPIVNPKRARTRQLHIIDRMVENGFITIAQAAQAKQEPLKLRRSDDSNQIHAEYLAETVRQMIYAQYGDETYTRGINVLTTVRTADQQAAYRALRQGILDYERRQVYRGPEKFLQLPAGNGSEVEDAIDDALDDIPDNGELLAAVVLEASPKKVSLMRRGSEPVEVTGEGLKPVQSGLADKAAPQVKLRRGAVVRVVKTAKGNWELTQLPEVEGAFVAMDPRTGSITAMVGGFDYAKNKFNHVTQAWRQPGSSFKPFIYSAALEKGFNGATIVNDAPLFFSGGVTGSQAWEPKNYDGKFEGPMPLRTALAKSKNMVSIRILQSVGAQNAQDWITRFGFEADKHPPYLTMALGAGSVTPLQMVTGYSVFANGGHRLNPYIVSRLTDQKGRVLAENQPVLPSDESTRTLDERNAFVMMNLLQEITRSGTAAKAQATLKRPDLYGKTGTTNDSMDAWFVGFQPTLAAAVWIGYDTPKKLGDRETGGGLALPVWISYMETALKNVPVMEPTAPEGLVSVGGEWMYDDMGRGKAVSSLGMDESPGPQTLPASEEKRKILDLFKN